MSTKPGVTRRPLASISSVALPETLPTAAILPSFTAMSAWWRAAPVPSATGPPRTIRSKSFAMVASPYERQFTRSSATRERQPETTTYEETTTHPRQKPHPLSGKRPPRASGRQGVDAVGHRRYRHRRQSHDQDLQAMSARRIDELRKEGAEEDQGLGVAQRHQHALHEEAAAWPHRRPGLAVKAAGPDHLPAEPDQVGRAGETQPVEPVPGRLHQRGEAESDHADHQREPDLRAEPVRHAGARAVANAVGEDQRHRRAGHQHDDQAGDEVGSVKFERHP